MATKRLPIQRGDRFGLLVATGEITTTIEGQRKRVFVELMCDCGSPACWKRSESLYSGNAKSCGCRWRKGSPVHGGSGTRLFATWNSMRSRCNNPNVDSYPRYGGAGIKVCPEWDSFEAFRDWALSNGYTDELTIERKKNHLGYSPGNCTWIPKPEQSLNRRNTIYLTAFGETKTLMDWTVDSRCTASRTTIWARLKKGWPHEKAISEPLGFSRFKVRQ